MDESSERFERRLATILSADVDDYSIMMAANEDRTVATLELYREVITRCVRNHEGRPFGIAGDSIMAEFANPISAVLCAATIQSELADRNAALPQEEKQLFRLGLNCGEFIVRGQDLFGDELNVAARLQQLARPGGIVLSKAVMDRVAGKVALKFKSLGPRLLKNISRQVECYAVETAEPDLKAARDLEDPWLASYLARPVPGFGERPALAVLPFNSSGDVGDREYIADGFAEDLINGLSNVRWVPVISRNSSFVFRDSTLEPQIIGRALGARYLVDGRLFFYGDRLRFAVTLIDAENGENVWHDRYDLEQKNMLDVEGELVREIVTHLDLALDQAEALRSRKIKPEKLDSWALIRRGTWHINKLTREDSAEAFKLFHQALERDPQSVEVRIQLAWWHFWDVWARRGDFAGSRETERYARAAVRLDERDPRGYLLIGIAKLMMREPTLGRSHLQLATGLNPSLAPAHACTGSTYILEGEPGKAIEPLLLSLRLNPRDPHRFHYLGELAVAHYMLTDWDKACEFAARSLESRPGYWYARAVTVASLARKGNLDQARRLLAAPQVGKSAEITNDRINWLPFVEREWNQYLIDGVDMARQRPGLWGRFLSSKTKAHARAN